MAKAKKHRLWLATEKLCDKCEELIANRVAFVVSAKRPVAHTSNCGCRFIDTDRYNWKRICDESLAALGIDPKPGTVVEFELKPVKKGKR